MDIEAELAGIAGDHLSGARALADRGFGVLEAICARGADSRDAWVEMLWGAGRRLIAAQPSMAPLLNMVNCALLAAEEGEALSAVREATLSRLAELRRAWRQHTPQAAEQAVTLTPHGARVLTHSNSSAVRACLLRAHSAGRRLRVTCTESRPMQEGVALARDLAEAGIEVTLIADALAPAEVARSADVAVVGADAVSHDGLVNKAGTLGIALAARYFGKPAYAVCGSDKFVPAGCARLLSIDDPRRPDELLPGPVPGVAVRNVQFDLTPLECFAAIVTEEGPLSPGEVLTRVGNMPVHPRLAAASADEVMRASPCGEND